MRQVAPEAKWHVYEPLSFGYAEQATRRLFGKTLRARCDFRQPDVIVSLDADFLGAADEDAIANSRAFAERRTPDDERSSDEPSVCPGANADSHRRHG